MAKPRSDTAKLVAENVTALALDVNEPLVRLLVTGRQLCGDDLDAFLVLLVIVQQAERHEDFASLDPEQLAKGEVDEIPSLDMNIQSIAGYVGIPKETVRRKVLALVERGWVAREGSMLRLTPEGYLALTPARQAAIALAAGISDAVDRKR